MAHTIADHFAVIRRVLSVDEAYDALDQLDGAISARDALLRRWLANPTDRRARDRLFLQTRDLLRGVKP